MQDTVHLTLAAMLEIAWIKILSTESEYRDNDYIFKRKGKEGSYRYQVWCNNKMLDNTLQNEFDIKRLIAYGFKNGLPTEFRK